MSVTIEQVKMDTKRVANRLKHRVVMADSLIVEIENANEQLVSMRHVIFLSTPNLLWSN